MGAITDERLGELYGMIEPLNMRIKAIRDEAERRALAGITDPHWKTVAKKADRLWKDTATAALSAALGPDVIEHKLKSPAVVEKFEPARQGARRRVRLHSRLWINHSAHV